MNRENANFITSKINVAFSSHSVLSQDGKPLPDNPRWKFIEEDDSYTLLIYEVQPEDAGPYACVAINEVGKATCTAKLDVQCKFKRCSLESHLRSLTDVI